MSIIAVRDGFVDLIKAAIVIMTTPVPPLADLRGIEENRVYAVENAPVKESKRVQAVVSASVEESTPLFHSSPISTVTATLTVAIRGEKEKAIELSELVSNVIGSQILSVNSTEVTVGVLNESRSFGNPTLIEIEAPLSFVTC